MPDIAVRSSVETFARAYTSRFDSQSQSLATAATTPPTAATLTAPVS